MATLTVLKFEAAEGAQQALDTIQSLQKRSLIQLHDAAIVTWPEGAKKPKTRQLVNMTGVGALNGAFWGMLFGLLFFIPLIGAAVGGAMGALTGRFSDIGIDDNFIKEVRDNVTEGTSALFLLTSNAVLDKVAEEFKGQDFEIVSTNLSNEEEQRLRDAFAEEEA